MRLGEMKIEDAAQTAAGNWQHFNCFSWHRASEINDPETGQSFIPIIVIWFDRIEQRRSYHKCTETVSWQRHNSGTPQPLGMRLDRWIFYPSLSPWSYYTSVPHLPQIAQRLTDYPILDEESIIAVGNTKRPSRTLPMLHGN